MEKQPYVEVPETKNWDLYTDDWDPNNIQSSAQVAIYNESFMDADTVICLDEDELEEL